MSSIEGGRTAMIKDDKPIEFSAEPPAFVENPGRGILCDHTDLGTVFERTPYFTRLELYNRSSLPYPKVVKKKASTEFLRLIDLFSLPQKSLPQFIHVFFHYYDQIPKCDHKRGIEVLVSVTLYLYCTESFIHVPYVQFFSKINCSRVDFNRTLAFILKENKSLMLKLRSDEFRKKHVNHLGMGLKNEFRFPSDFIVTYQKFLGEYWEELKHRKDSIITSILYLLTKNLYKKQILVSDTKICTFLGLYETTLGNLKTEYGLQKKREKKIYQKKSWLYDQYIVQDKTQKEIGKIENVSQNTISVWLGKFNLRKNVWGRS